MSIITLILIKDLELYNEIGAQLEFEFMSEV